VGVSVFFGSYQAAVKEGGAALASVLLYTAPAWVAILSRVFFREIFTGRKLVALAGVMAGTLLLSLGGGGDVQPGVAAIGFGLLAGFTYALHFILGKRYLRDYSGATLYCLFLPVGALGLLPFVEFQATGWIAWAAFVFLGLVCTYLAYICYCAGLKILAPTKVAVVATLEPVVAAFLAFTLWQEYFSSLGYVGGVLVLAAVVLMVLEGRGKESV
jgi:drug/metabolite transporter, DME family